MREKLLHSIYKSFNVPKPQNINIPEIYKLFDEFFHNKVYCFLNIRDQKTIKIIEKKPHLFNHLPNVYYRSFSIESEKEIATLLGMFNELKKIESTCYIVSIFPSELFQKAYSVFESHYPNIDFGYYRCEEKINGEDVEEIFCSINENDDEDIRVYIDSRVLPKIYIRKPPTLE